VIPKVNSSLVVSVCKTVLLDIPDYLMTSLSRVLDVWYDIWYDMI